MKAMKTFAALLALAFGLAGCGAVDGDPVRPAPGSACIWARLSGRA